MFIRFLIESMQMSGLVHRLKLQGYMTSGGVRQMCHVNCVFSCEFFSSKESYYEAFNKVTNYIFLDEFPSNSLRLILNELSNKS